MLGAVLVKSSVHVTSITLCNIPKHNYGAVSAPAALPLYLHSSNTMSEKSDMTKRSRTDSIFSSKMSHGATHPMFVTELFKDIHIKMLNWAGNSPDLNPVEYW